MAGVFSLSYPALAALLLVAGYAVLNLKALPLAHTLRLLPSVYRLMHPRIFHSRPRQLLGEEEKPVLAKPPTTLFRTHVSSSCAVFGDLDVNLHKSNSTFFADADVSRGELLTLLFSRACVEVTAPSSSGRRGQPANLILAGVQGRFLREIRPFQPYGIASRVLAWDESAIHVVTYFVRPGWGLESLEEELGGTIGPVDIMGNEKARKGVFAILVSRYVIRAGREKISPVDLFQAAGMDVEGDVESRETLESRRLGGIEYMKGCLF